MNYPADDPAVRALASAQIAMLGPDITVYDVARRDAHNSDREPAILVKLIRHGYGDIALRDILEHPEQAAARALNVQERAALQRKPVAPPGPEDMRAAGDNLNNAATEAEMHKAAAATLAHSCAAFDDDNLKRFARALADAFAERYPQTGELFTETLRARFTEVSAR